MKKVLREPFVHFVLLGLMLFAGHSLWQKHVLKSEHTIYISPAEMERQAQIFSTENRRQPSDSDLEGLLFAHIEEQVLMREAIRLGLDEDDTIIKRRLAQKMRFMIDDVSVPNVPERTELKTWFNANTARFIRPETRSFEHIYLSPKNRTDTVISDAEALLSAGIAENWKPLGDPFITGLNFKELTQTAVQQNFGRPFAQKLFTLPDMQDWQGPVNSVFGVHLVRFTDVSSEFLPEFDDIQAEVEAAWLDEAKREENSKALEALIEKYKVEVTE